MADTKTTVHEVTVAMTRYMTYRVEGSRDVESAVRSAVSHVWDGDDPDEEDSMPGLEVQRVKVGDQELELSYHYDWWGPKDARGLAQQVTTVRVDGKKVAEDRDFGKAVRLAEASLDDGVSAEDRRENDADSRFVDTQDADTWYREDHQ